MIYDHLDILHIFIASRDLQYAVSSLLEGRVYVWDDS